MRNAGRRRLPSPCGVHAAPLLGFLRMAGAQGARNRRCVLCDLVLPLILLFLLTCDVRDDGQAEKRKPWSACRRWLAVLVLLLWFFCEVVDGCAVCVVVVACHTKAKRHDETQPHED